MAEFVVGRKETVYDGNIATALSSTTDNKLLS